MKYLQYWDNEKEYFVQDSLECLLEESGTDDQLVFVICSLADKGLLNLEDINALLPDLPELEFVE